MQQEKYEEKIDRKGENSKKRIVLALFLIYLVLL